MNILDENIVFSQRRQLQAYRLPFKQIGVEIGRAGMKDQNDIIPLLHSRRRPTFFTRDNDFYHPRLRHPGYCPAHLDVAFDAAADYIGRFLRHAAFRTQKQRMGKVIRVHSIGLSYWQVGSEKERVISW